VQAWQAAAERGEVNPRDIKMKLAWEITARFHGETAAHRAQEAFVARFSRGQLPEDIPEVQVQVPPEGLPIANVLKEAGLVASTSEGLRMIAQRAVRLDQTRVEDKGLRLFAPGDHLLQVGGASPGSFYADAAILFPLSHPVFAPLPGVGIMAGSTVSAVRPNPFSQIGLSWTLPSFRPDTRKRTATITKT